MNKSMLYRLCRKYSEHEFTDEDLDDGLVLAEARIGRDLKTRWNLSYSVVVATQLGSSTSLAVMPAELRTLRQAIALADGTKYTLTEEQTGHLFAVREDPYCHLFYGATGNDLQLALDPPVPIVSNDPDAPNLGIYFYRQPPALTDEIIPYHPATVFPDVYVHGCLMEAARLAANDAAKESATAEYATALDLANMSEQENTVDQGLALPELQNVIGG